MLVYLFLVACGDDKESHPEVNASIELSNDITRYAGQKIKFGANTINAEHIQWDLGDGNQTNDSTFTHVYRNKGTYIVQLDAWNESNSISDQLTIEVKDSIEVFVTGNSSKKWNLFSIENQFGSNCICQQSYTFYSNQEVKKEFWKEVLICKNGETDNCSSEVKRHRIFRVSYNENNFRNVILIGPGAWMAGYEIEVTDELLILKSGNGSIHYYAAE